MIQNLKVILIVYSLTILSGLSSLDFNSTSTSTSTSLIHRVESTGIYHEIRSNKIQNSNKKDVTIQDVQQISIPIHYSELPSDIQNQIIHQADSDVNKSTLLEKLNEIRNRNPPKQDDVIHSENNSEDERSVKFNPNHHLVNENDLVKAHFITKIHDSAHFNQYNELKQKHRKELKEISKSKFAPNYVMNEIRDHHHHKETEQLKFYFDSLKLKPRVFPYGLHVNDKKLLYNSCSTYDSTQSSDDLEMEKFQYNLFDQFLHKLHGNDKEKVVNDKFTIINHANHQHSQLESIIRQNEEKNHSSKLHNHDMININHHRVLESNKHLIPLIEGLFNLHDESKSIHSHPHSDSHSHSNSNLINFDSISLLCKIPIKLQFHHPNMYESDPDEFQNASQGRKIGQIFFQTVKDEYMLSIGNLFDKTNSIKDELNQFKDRIIHELYTSENYDFKPIERFRYIQLLQSPKRVSLRFYVPFHYSLHELTNIYNIEKSSKFNQLPLSEKRIKYQEWIDNGMTKTENSMFKTHASFDLEDDNLYKYSVEWMVKHLWDDTEIYTNYNIFELLSNPIYFREFNSYLIHDSYENAKSYLLRSMILNPFKLSTTNHIIKLIKFNEYENELNSKQGSRKRKYNQVISNSEQNSNQKQNGKEMILHFKSISDEIDSKFLPKSGELEVVGHHLYEHVHDRNIESNQLHSNIIKFLEFTMEHQSDE